MKKATLLSFAASGFACLIGLGAAGRCEAQQRDRNSLARSWAVGTIRTSDLNPDQVKALLGRAADDATVCDYAFADLAGDGFYRLVVSVDYSGRRFCNTLEVVANNGARQELDVWNVEHVSDVLIAEAGRQSLRAPEAITDYEGAKCIAVVPIFYSDSGDSLALATSAHLADYQALRAKMYTAPPTDACGQAVADKIDRLLGDKTAGMTHAREWMVSQDPSLRRKAVRVLQDIGTSDALAALRRLVIDKDPIVAQEASTALTR